MKRCSPVGPPSSRFLSPTALVLAGLLLSPLPAAADEPLSREQLSRLVEQMVETPLIVALVKRNCVSFAIDGNNLASLAASLPKPVLEAAIECRSQAAPPSVPATVKPASLTPVAAPAAAPAPVVAPAQSAAPAPAAILAPTVAPAPAVAPSLGAPAAPPAAIAPSFGPATLALQVEDSHSEAITLTDLPNNECQVFVDSPASLKVYATAGNSLGTKPAILFDYAYRNAARGVYNSERIPLAPGIHEVAVYCGPVLKRNTVGLTAESGKKYTVVMKLNNLLGGTAKVIDVRTE